MHNEPGCYQRWLLLTEVFYKTFTAYIINLIIHSVVAIKKPKRLHWVWLVFVF